MKLKICLQTASQSTDFPKSIEFKRWVKCVLKQPFLINAINTNDCVELTIRLIDETESAALNSTYRNKSGPTNILSFPFENSPYSKEYYLGDLAICAPLVIKEAQEQHKKTIAHWAHLTVHGLLHLLGYDHIKARDAKIMEAHEIEILCQLGFENPYVI